jgi:5-methylcytosine-specific restriction endonuclease McrA
VAKRTLLRKIAKANGSKFYRTGIACVNGHICDRRTKDGTCVECQREKDRRRYHADVEKARLRVRLLRARNPERYRRINKNSRDKDPQKVRDRAKQYRKDHPTWAAQQDRFNFHLRRARKKALAGTITKKQMFAMLEQQNWLCVYCPTSLREKKELDHWIPLIRDGLHDISNVQWLCPSCNQQKKARNPIEFEASIGFIRTFAPGLRS